MITSLGEARRRQEAAKKRGERFKVSDDVRAARAAVLERQEAVAAERQAAVAAERQARPDAVRAILQHAPDTDLFEFQRVAGQLDGRRLAEIVADVLQQRRRTAYRPAPQEAQEAAAAARASSASRSAERRP